MLQLALQDPDVLKVIAPSRRPLPPHAKLENPIVDFDKLPEDAFHMEAHGRVFDL